MPFVAFVELLPGWPEPEVAALSRAGARLGPEEGWAVVSTPEQVRRAPASATGLWLRGLEAGGEVEPFTALVLMRAAAKTGLPWVAEGLGIRAMAASLAIGATGIAIGAHLWGLPSAPLAEGPRRALAGRPRARDTVVLGELLDRRVRVLGRPSAALRALREADTRGEVDAFDTITRSGLERWWARDGLVPAPQCIAEAARWGPFGDAASAVAGIRAAVEAALAAIRSRPVLREDPLGTGLPVVQGPMANVAEGPALARAVSAAGGLPFFALGALDPERAREVLRGARDVPGRFGAGVIGFDVAPSYRDAHLDLVAELAPGAPVTLAGGGPELAQQARARGLEPWLHTPSGRLAGQALHQGVGAVILEGHEAGGHVGALTSAGLWEEGLEAVEAFVASGGPPPLVVLAGGIGDAPSAAFAAAMAGEAAAKGARVALQAGTAFFFTREIVEAGQLTPTCQAVALGVDRTVLVGSTANLPLRCAPNAWTAEARAAERGLEAEGMPLEARRAALERANVGRTRVAAKGIERDPAHGADPRASRYREVPLERQLDEGAFTMGQGAAVTREVVSVAEVVRALSTEAASILDRRAASPWGDVATVAGRPSAEVAAIPAPVRLGPRSRAPSDAPIAIVGLGCVLPRAFDVAAFWSNLVHGVDAIGPIPEERWSIERYWDPEAGPRGPARSRSRVAGAVDGFAFDPLRFRIPPRVAATMDPAQRLALHATAEAVGGLTVDGARTAVIFGNAMGGEYGKDLALRVRWREVLAPLREGPLAHLSERDWADLEAHVDAALGERLPPLNGNSMAGVLSNVIAGRVAQWLDARGGNFTVDAACASSLAAVAIGVDWLRNGRVDTVVTGGVDSDLSPETFVGFTLAGALSGAGSRPFARGADGFVMGEGCGVLVLERLDDALRRGRPVWAVLRGVGQSSDGRGRGITAPKAEGQRMALDRALQEAGVEVGSLGMVEAHGTGTTIGDRTETAALREAFAGAEGVWLGSVKSMLGHLKGAAGAAGLVKAALSVATGVVPPTLNAGPVDPELGLAGGPFRLPRAPVAFPGSPRRAGVSAFGFGGTNFHVILEQAPPEAATPPSVADLRDISAPLLVSGPAAEWPLSAMAPASAIVLAWGAADPDALARRVESGDPMDPAAVAALPHRLAVVTSLEERDRAVVRALRSLREGAAAPDVFRGEGPARPVVVLVPGQGALRAGSVASLLRVAPHAFDGLEAALQEHTELDPAALEAEALEDVHALHLLMLALAVGWGTVLAEAGLPIAATVGHSLGEYGALVLAGRLGAEEALRAVSVRGLALRGCAPGGMIAVALPEAEARIAAEAHGVSIGALNGPRSTILSGPPGPLAAVRAELAGRGVPVVDVPVARAFHSPAVEAARGPLADALASAAFREGEPVISGRTARPFGADPREDLVEALIEPVRFSEAVAAARMDGDPVEIGPGRALGRHVPGCVTLDPDPGDPAGIVRAAAALLARGHAGLLRVAVGGTPTATGARGERSEPRVAEARSGERGERSEPRVAEARSGERGERSEPRVAEARSGERGERSEPRVAEARSAVLAAIAEVTGYPPEAITEGADLEGELGIDSIRRLEILGVLQEKLGITADEHDQARLARADLDGLVQFVAGARAAPEAPSAPTGWRAYAPIRRPAEPGGGPGTRIWRPSPTGSTTEERARSVVTEGLALDLDPEVTDTLIVEIGDDPAERAAAGLARCLGLERGIAVRAVRRDGDAFSAEALVPYAVPEATLPERPVIVATGGATGIVARALAGLAGLHPRVLLLGRRREADLTALAGIEARYLSCDVRDAEAVRVAVATAREAWGRIDVVVHGAGVLSEDPDKVLAVKLDGAAALMAATAEDHPTLWVAFSSLAAWSGNVGQGPYAAANAVLDGWKHPTAARSLSIGWTAWSTIGMAAPLERVLRGRGVVALPPEVGAAAFLGLLGASGHVLVGPDPADSVLHAAAPWPFHAFRLGGSSVAILGLDPDDPALADHRIGGRPLVPAALWIRAMAALVGLLEGPGPVSIERFAVLAPTFVEKPRRDVRIEASPSGGGWRLSVLAGSTEVARAVARRVEPPPSHPAPQPLADARAAAPWYRDDVWFHGPAWQVLERVQGDGNGLASADSRATAVDALAAAVDAAHQLLAAWSAHDTGFLGLPVSADRWLVAGEPDGPVRIETKAVRHADGVEAEVVVTDRDGRVVLIGDGVKLRRATRWPDGVPDPLRGA